MGAWRSQLAVDMEKAIGWKGLTFFTNGYQIHGQSISALNLGVLMPVSFIEALPSTRLFELWLEQKLLDDHLSFRFGQLSADTEFIISKGAGAFLNATWGWPSIAGINLPDGGPSYPLAAPGARARLQSQRQPRLPHRRLQRRPGGRLPGGSAASLQSARARLPLQLAAADVRSGPSTTIKAKASSPAR